MRRARLFMLSRALAWVLGIAIPLGETVRRWGDWGYPPRWLDDFLIGGFLLLAAWRSTRDPRHGRAWLTGAWCFGAGILYCSFFGHLEAIREPDSGNIPRVPLIVLIGTAWITMLVAIAITLMSEPRAGDAVD